MHTKGPWKVSNLERPHHVLVCNEKWYTVARVFSANKSGDPEANARLIAAAPELLEALQAIVQVLGGSQPKDPIGAYFIAEAAIRKAKEN